MLEFDKEEILEYGKGKRKKRIIFIREASGIDKTREAVLLVMGKDRWEYVDDNEEK